MSIFTTTADTQFNAFSNNPNVMAQQGGWNMDPNYMTPSFDAPYRPDYQGNNGASAVNSEPGFWNSAFTAATGPLQPTSMVGNPIQNFHPMMESLYGTPMDAGAETGQRLFAPLAAFAIGYKMSNVMVRRANDWGGRMAAFGTKMFGGTLGKQRKARMFQGYFSSLGDRAGQGFVNSLFGTARRFSKAGILSDGVAAAAWRSRIAMTTGIVGGAASGFVLPYLAGEAIAAPLDKAIFEPYLGNRLTGKHLREDFAHVMVGDEGQGNHVTGMGLSFQKSQQIAGDITESGIRDWTLTPTDMSHITDLSARAGLLDNAKADQIAGRVADIAKQVKLVMRVADILDKSEVIKLLAKLQTAGASVENGAAGKLLSAIGSFSAVGGISTQRMMNTVGEQGQYLFQANGMAPYLGQITAAKSFASFASAYRSGLISPALLASMGGPEGAAQASLTAQVNGSQTMYNSLVLSNRYLLNNPQEGVNNNVAASGRDFAKDPLMWSGAIGMYGDLMRSKQFQDKGPMGLHDQIVDMAKSASPWEFKDKNGRVDLKNGKIPVEVAYAYLTQGIGETHSNALAYLTELQSMSDPKTRVQMEKALRGHMIEQSYQYADQEGLRYGTFTNMWRDIKHAGQDVQSYFNRDWQGVMEGAGSAMDTFEQDWHGWLNGNVQKGNPIKFDSIEEFLNAGKAPVSADLLDTSKIGISSVRSTGNRDYLTNSPFAHALKNINGAILTGSDKNAERISQLVKNGKYNDGNKKELTDVLTVMASQGKLGTDAKDNSTNTEYMKSLANKLLDNGTTHFDFSGRGKDIMQFDETKLVNQDDVSKHTGTLAALREMIVDPAVAALSPLTVPMTMLMGREAKSDLGVRAAKDIYRGADIRARAPYELAMRQVDDWAREGDSKKAMLANTVMTGKGEERVKAIKTLFPDIGKDQDSLDKFISAMDSTKKVKYGDTADFRNMGAFANTGRRLMEVTKGSETKDPSEMLGLVEASRTIIDQVKNGDLSELDKGGSLEAAGNYIKSKYKGVDQISDIYNKAQDVYKSSVDQGVMGWLGIRDSKDSNVMETVEKAMKNPGRYLNAEDAKMVSGLDKNPNMQKYLVMAALGKEKGLTDVQEAVKLMPKNATIEEYKGYQDIVDNYNTQKKYINQVAGSNQIDFQTKLMMDNANSMQKSISLFGKYVESFGTAVQNANPNSVQNGATAPQIAHPAFGWGSLDSAANNIRNKISGALGLDNSRSGNNPGQN